MRPTGLSKAFLKFKELISFQQFMGMDDPFSDGETERISDPYRTHAWVNIAVSTLMRNIGRASFRITRNGEFVTSGPVFELFRDVNPVMNRFDLWKATSAWWFLEGEAFWFFGDNYKAGIPEEIFVLNPRKMRAQVHGRAVRNERPAWTDNGVVRRWFYSTDKGEVPIFPDEIIHFKDWNPWNEIRGVTPLIALSQEIEQDQRANSATTKLLRNNAVPEGILKTDQVLREDEADKLERRWETIYGKKGMARRIAVLGKGTSFEPLTMTPAALKFFDLKRWNLYTILAKYGIPPRVAHVQDVRSGLSGKDTAEQHSAFWKYTIIPTLRNFEQIIETQFFGRFGLRELGVFDTADIPELQESEAERSKRDISEIEAGIKTINDVLTERGLEPKKWGDTWYRPARLVPVGPSAEEELPDNKDAYPSSKRSARPGSVRDLEKIYNLLLKREEALISVFGAILRKEGINRQEEFEKLVKACFFYGIKEIYQKAEAGNEFTPYYVDRVANEAIVEWSRSNSLVKSKWEGLEQQYPNFIHLWIDDAKIYALGKLGFTFYKCISKSWYGILGSEKKAVRDRRLKLFRLEESEAVNSGSKGFSHPLDRDEL
jgi:HK97 family phage portal protein